MRRMILFKTTRLSQEKDTSIKPIQLAKLYGMKDVQSSKCLKRDYTFGINRK